MAKSSQPLSLITLSTDGIIKLTEKSLQALHRNLQRIAPLKLWKDRLVAVWVKKQDRLMSKMAQLFGRDIKTIGKHIHNALHEELASAPTGANFATIENRKQRLMDEHDRLFPDNHIDIRKWRNESHNR